MAKPLKRRMTDSVNSPSPQRARVELDMGDKIALIKESLLKPKPTLQALANKYGIGWSTVSDILKNKSSYLDGFHNNCDKTKLRLTYSCKFAEVNKLTYEWFKQARAKYIPISGPIVCEKAASIAQKLGITDFKASTGWLNSFKNRHSIRGYKICGESADVDPTAITEYKSRLPDIISGYAECDVFNCDETGLFYRALPDKTLNEKSMGCKGGKLAKDRVTVMLCCSAMGEKLKPLVIGKSVNPRCFKRIDKSALPVTYESNKKSWMTGSVFEKWVTDLNNRMRRQKRRILLFMDNATSHTYKQEMDCVIIKYLPANTTSKLQLLDLGIIRAFKARYRKFMLRCLLCKIDSSKNASDLAKAITLLDAIHWVAKSWKATMESTIQSCFHHAGLIQNDISCDVNDAEDDDPDDDIPLRQLIDHFPNCDFVSSAEAESAIPTEEIFDGDDWEENFINSVSEVCCSDDDDDDVDNCDNIDHPGLKVSKSEVFELLERLEYYSLENDSIILEDVRRAKSKKEHEIVVSKLNKKQSKLSTFFKTNDDRTYD